MLREEIARTPGFPKLDANCICSSDFKNKVPAQSISSVLEVHQFSIGQLLFPGLSASTLRNNGIWFHKYHYTKTCMMGKLTLLDAPNLIFLSKTFDDRQILTAYRLSLAKEIERMLTERGEVRCGVKVFLPINAFAYLFRDAGTLRKAPQTYILHDLGEQLLEKIFFGDWRTKLHETGGQLTECSIDINSLVFRKQRLGDSLWDAWAHLCSSSTHLKNQTLSERIIGMALALGGLFFYSLLTSTMTAQFKLRMEWLREGAHSQVRETGHILICGVNDRIITVLRQLNKSHEFALRVGQADKKRQTVLILSEQSKKETERVIASLDKEWPLLNVLVRSGSLSSTFSFESVAADKTRTILIFSNKKDMYAADADVALCMLGLQPLLEGYTGKVIAEVSSTSTGKLIQSLSQSKAEPVQNLSSKIFVQCSRQRALIDVYCQLLDHSKQIINIRNYPSLFGFQYRDIRRGFPEAIICGFIRAKKVNFHPDDKEVLQVDDKLLVIAPKHTHSKAPDALLASTMPEPPMSKNVPIKKGKQVAKHSKSCKVSGKKELILMLGWRTDVCDMVLEYDEYVGPGSELVILAECSPDKRRAHIASRIQKPLKNITVVHKIGNPLYQVDLQNAILDATRGQGRPPLSIVAITDERGTTGDIIKPDKQTMYALLLAEELCKEHMIQVASLVAEVVDKKLGKQVADTQTSLRYIAASEVTGLVTTQVTEHPELNMVWTELLNSWGNEIYVKDIMLYIEAGETLSFSQLSERAVSRHEVAIGYRKGSNIVINPPKKDISLKLLQGDALVVICENE